MVPFYSLKYVAMISGENNKIPLFLFEIEVFPKKIFKKIIQDGRQEVT
jgi:hypothetical protein